MSMRALVLFHILGTYFKLLRGECIKYEVPPTEIPEELLEEFTSNGSVPVSYHYVDDSFNGKGSHYRYDRDELDAWVAHWESRLQQANDGETLVNIDKNRDWVVAAVKEFREHIAGATVGVCKQYLKRLWDSFHHL